MSRSRFLVQQFYFGRIRIQAGRPLPGEEPVTAVALAGFDEADKLRKVIAKKAGGNKLAAYEKQFFEGCAKNGVDSETVKQIWEMMLSFDGYSFCKPHSASYAMVSFQSAWLRVHYPAEFMAGVLSNQGGYYRPCAYISESRRMGLIAEGPDINVSRYRYYGIGRQLIVGFMAIKGLSKTGIEAIVKERLENGNFISLEDFSRRVRISRDDIVALVPSGIFDSISGGKPRALQARALLSLNAISSKTGNEQKDLFAMGPPPINLKAVVGNTIFTSTQSRYVTVKRTSEIDLLGEYKSLGFLRSLHPLALWKDKVLAIKRIKARYIGEYIGQRISLVGWPVTQKEVWTKDGLTMSFLTFEDETALYETVVFPQVYDRYNSLLFDQLPLLLYGKVCEEWGAFSIKIVKAERIV
jgi:DNA polymerase-3 subunit alpha/error-prone DNA polymerase